MTEFTPQDPNFRQRIEDSFSSQKFMSFIGANVVKIEPGFCEIHLPFSESLTQQNGFFHAGVISTLADNASGYAAYTLMHKDSAILTTEFKINLLAPANGELLIGRGMVRKYGRTLTICQSEVFIVKDGIEKLCGLAQLSMMELKAE